MQQITVLALALTLLNLCQSFEFDLKSTNFAPGGAPNQYNAVNFADDEDNAGFTSGGGSGSGGIGGTRRLIQPPPLKRSSMFPASSIPSNPPNTKWMLFQRPSLNYYYMTRI
uniref:Uncharacterized protein n=1 Tax=Ditylenchus dipsaci TaxID=166011 RepID=A0A915CT18_9BILA